MTWYMMGCITHNAKYILNLLILPPFMVSTKKVPDLFLTKYISYNLIFHILLLKRSLTHSLQIHVPARRAGPWSCLIHGAQMPSGHSPPLVCAFFSAPR